MTSGLPQLPITHALPELLRSLEQCTSAVLVAPPGAGKTTIVPVALLGAPWRGDLRIVMLEPRRVAARAAARRMASLLNETVGETIGLRMRMETRVSESTRVEVVTEAVLTRMIQADPALEGYAAVIFDEFHERSLNADLGLALVEQTHSVLRGDLRILVMSATLDAEPVAGLIQCSGAPAPVIRSEGRTYPVELRWRAPRAGQRLEGATAAAVREALDTTEGDILVFLPGIAEIRRTEELLTAALPTGASASSVRVLPLHGGLSADMQDAALAPARAGERKVVLATNIAESSLTIDGVRCVIDAGLARVPRFDPRNGMTRLTTVRASRAAADQRSGRAGRQAPGVCIRLWDEHEHALLPTHPTPEILEADLAPLALELAAAAIRDPGELAWLNLPPAGALAQARELLHELRALDADAHITPHGTQMAALPVHPRIAHMLLASRTMGHEAAATACELAALLSERDLLRSREGLPDADLRLRLALVFDESASQQREVSVKRSRRPPETGLERGALERVRRQQDTGLERGALERVRRQCRDLRHRMSIPPRTSADHDRAGAVLALAFPDRVARARQNGRYLLRNGTGAALGPHSSLIRDEWLVVAESDGRRPEALIVLAAPVDEADVLGLFHDQVVETEVVEWDPRTEAVVARQRQQLGAIMLRESTATALPDEQTAPVLLERIRQEGLDCLTWSAAAQQLRNRVRFAARLEPGDWPDLSRGTLLNTLNDWLLPFLAGVRTQAELQRVDLHEALLALLPWAQREALDEIAPTGITVPAGRRVTVDYSDPAAPKLAARIQDFFGLSETPTVGRGQLPLVLHLLSPAQRPVQVTSDLAGFWRTSYADVRKDMKGRYPRHHWPEDGSVAPSPPPKGKRKPSGG